MTGTFPLIVSPDDHVVEPRDLWSSRLPIRCRDAGPTVERQRLGNLTIRSGQLSFEETEDGQPADVWIYEDLRSPSWRPAAAVGFPKDDVRMVPITFEEMRPGCFDPAARIADMDIAGVESSMCFPNMFVRFCGQTFAESKDKDLALLCVRAYNDWMVDEWCGRDPSRLVPLCIVPLWDADLAVDELKRNANRGVRAVSFSELPTNLGLPSIHSGYWDRFFGVCEETGTLVAMHIGSGSKMVTTSEDAPGAVVNSLLQLNAALSMTDWLYSGIFERNPKLRVYFAECQIGWIPYLLERVDKVWDQHRGWNEVRDGLVPEPPSTYFRSNVYCSFFDDEHGVASIDEIGIDNVMYETDYPHADSVWPDCIETAQRLTSGLSDDVVAKVVRENARTMLRLDS